MRILACDPNACAADAERLGATLVDIDTALAEADYLCLQCPLTAETRGMISLPEFRRMKPSAALVNTARGALVNEDDLVTALRDGLIRYAALDVFGQINVFQTGGFATDHPLFSLDNVLVTPHVAAVSEEATGEAHIRGIESVIDVLAGAWPKHPVNPDLQPWFEITRP